MMRMICMFFAAAFALNGSLAMRSDEPRDIIVIVDTSGMTPEEAGDEPWLASPCLNPCHHYYRPLFTENTDATYPASIGTQADTSVDYRFTSCFLLEKEAVGWRPWENHYRYDETGAPVRIAQTGQEGDCVYADDLCRTLAVGLIAELLADNPDCRVALCCVGGPFDTRFCVNFTRDEEKLVNALYAAPPSGIGDISTALVKAEEYLQRRNADERRARSAAVIVLCVDEIGDGLYVKRAQKEALRLMENAALIWASPLDVQAEDILRLLGTDRRTTAASPVLSISLHAATEGRVSLER